jgi:probable phosphoglycerate mutase
MATQILFIRHGETAWNQIRRIQGHLDIPLAGTGVEQAQRLADRLSAEAGQGVRLDAIYSSDLLRAQQTAQPIADALGLPLRLNAGLRERHYGAFQGYDKDEIEARYPLEYAHWQTRDAGFAPPDGESMRAFYHRVTTAVKALVAAHSHQRIACVAHGGVLDCVYRLARDLTLDVPRDYPLLNTSVNTVEFAQDGAKVLAWADVAHLDAPSDDDSLQRLPMPGR